MARVRVETSGMQVGWAVMLCGALFAAGCGGDDSDDGDQGNAGNGAGSASIAGASGSTTPMGGNGSGSAGRGAGSGGRGGSSATTAGRGGNGGSTAAGSGGAEAGSTSMDAGTDGGNPDPTSCVAPTPAAESGNECPSGDPVALKLTSIRAGLTVPIFVTSAPDDESRLFVVQRNGLILILDPESGEPVEEFLDLADAITTSSSLDDERGLLGFAFHPDYPSDPRFFVQYTVDDGGLDNVISSFEVSAADPNVADPGSEQELLRFASLQGNHNGGMLAFGTDGCLFIGSGDGGASDDTGSGHAPLPGGNGQALDRALGKILRIDVDNPGERAPGNLASATYPHIWSYGLRNPWRFSFDRDTGDMYIGDVGQGAWEEIDVEPKGVSGRNYGWPLAEGNRCRANGSGCDQGSLDEFEPAIDEYPHGSGDDCVVGGYVYRGSAIPSLQGYYVYGDNGSGRKIRAFVWDGEGRCNDETIVLSTRDGLVTGADITSFGEDVNGELYVTTSNTLFRIDAE